MWIGNSLLFNWLDRNLVRPAEARPGAPTGTIGEAWLLHSGGFYEVKKQLLQPSQMPNILHWFKWQAYTTWATGICLLGIVYYSGGAPFLVDPSVSPISVPAAIGLGAGAIVAGWLIYDGLWRSPLRKHDALASGVSLTVIAIAVYGLTHTLSGRAAFIHVGAILGTFVGFFLYVGAAELLPEAHRKGRGDLVMVGTVAGAVFIFAVTRLVVGG